LSLTINHENWTYTQYTFDNLRAIISLGAELEGEDTSFCYFVTVLDDEEQEVFQQQFTSLDLACDYINKRYRGQWTYVDSNNPPTEKSGSCATCVAH
jgi:hypothetical protein